METRDLFISYTKKDKEWALWTASTLRSSGYTVYIQEDDCSPGTEFPIWMGKAIASTRGFLAIWSQDYGKSRHCEQEFSAAYAKTQPYPILPVSFRGNVNDADYATLFKGKVRLDLTSPEEQKNRTNLLNTVKKLIGNPSSSPLQPCKQDTMLEKDSTRKAYFNYLTGTLGEVLFEGMPADPKSGAVRVPLESIFVPLDYRRRFEESEELVKKLDKPETRPPKISQILLDSPHAAILARPGGGKSTLIRRIALAYADQTRRMQVADGLPDKDWFPIYLRCRDLGENARLSISQIVDDMVIRAGMERCLNTFRILTEEARDSGKLLLLIDGLDEISNEQNRMRFVQELQKYVIINPSVRLVITSRETGFRAVADTLSQYCDQYTIRDLDRDQIRTLSLKWHTAIVGHKKEAASESKKVCGVILQDARIRALAGNPLLLTTLLFVKRSMGYLPTQRYVLYGKMVELLLSSWNIATYAKLEMDETEPQLAFVAYSMTEQGQQTITRKELRECIEKARRALPDTLGYTKISPAQFIDLVEERSSLLIKRGIEEDMRGHQVPSYEFSHLSFQEYLTARAISENWLPESIYEDTKQGKPKDLVSLLKAHMWDVVWAEVIPLAIVLLGRAAASIVNAFLEEAIHYQNEHKEDIYNVKELPDDGIINGNAAALHLANSLANGVPMNPNTFEKVIMISVRSWDLISNFKGQDLEHLNPFTVILNSKYGDKFQEIVDSYLLGNFDLEDLYCFVNAWDYIHRKAHVPGLIEIEGKLLSVQREDNIYGTYYLMLSFLRGNKDDYKHYYEIDTVSQHNIFTAILKLLRSNDAISQYMSAWCISVVSSWRTDVIPMGLNLQICNELLELWLNGPSSDEFHRIISAALCTAIVPGFDIPDLPDLEAEVMKGLQDKNPDIRRLAISLGSLNHQLTSSEVRKYLKTVNKIYRNTRFFQESGYVDENGSILDEKGNETKE